MTGQGTPDGQAAASPPFDNHPYIRAPLPDRPLWRYIELWKLADLLSTQQMFHCRLDSIGEKFEGALTREDIEGLRRQFEEFEGPGQANASVQELANIHRRETSRAYASCWNCREHESWALWSLYAQHGVAIRSSVGRLGRALQRPDPIWNYYLAQVEYINHETDLAGAGNILRPLVRKRLDFEFEHEVRLLAQWMPDDDAAPQHVTAAVDTDELIEEIVVSPLVPPSAVDAVRAMCDALGVGAPVRHSAYAADPF